MTSLLQQSENTITYLEERQILDDLTNGIMNKFYKDQGLKVVQPRLPKTHVTDQMLHDYQLKNVMDEKGNVMYQALPPEPVYEEYTDYIQEILDPNFPTRDELIQQHLTPLVGQINHYENILNQIGSEIERLRRVPIFDESEANIVRITNRLAELNQDMNDVRDILVPLQHEYNIRLNDIQNHEQFKNDALRQKAIIDQRNQIERNAYEYRKENIGRTAILKEEGESPDEYAARLQEIQPDAFQLYQQAKEWQFQDLRKKFSTIIKNPSTVETLLHEMKSMPQSDELFQKVKQHFPLIKAQFEKSFGSNNEFTNIPINDLMMFIENVIVQKSKTIPREPREIKEEKKRYEIGDDPFEGLTLEDLQGFASEETRVKKEETRGKKEETRGRPTGIRKPSSIAKDYLAEKYNARELDERLRDTIQGQMFLEGYSGEMKKSQIIPALVNYEASRLKSGDDLTDNFKTVYGLGINKHVPFGKIKIHPAKLQEENILSIRDKNGYAVRGFPNVRVSSTLSDSILKKGGKITKEEHKKMSIEERQLFDELINVAGLKSQTHTSSEKTIEDLKKRLQLVIGQVEAGNNSKDLLKEYTKIMKRLLHFKVISYNQLQDALKDFKKMLADA